MPVGLSVSARGANRLRRRNALCGARPATELGRPLGPASAPARRLPPRSRSGSTGGRRSPVDMLPGDGMARPAHARLTSQPAYQRPRCTTSAKGRRLGRRIGNNGRVAG